MPRPGGGLPAQHQILLLHSHVEGYQSLIGPAGRHMSSRIQWRKSQARLAGKVREKGRKRKIRHRKCYLKIVLPEVEKILVRDINNKNSDYFFLCLGPLKLRLISQREESFCAARADACASYSEDLLRCHVSSLP